MSNDNELMDLEDISIVDLNVRESQTQDMEFGDFTIDDMFFLYGRDLDEKVESEQNDINYVEAFTKQLKNRGTINALQLDPFTMITIWHLVVKFRHRAIGLQFYTDSSMRMEEYREEFQKYKTAKNVINQISELLFSDGHESDVHESTYLDILRFWLRISNDFLDRSMNIANCYWSGGTALITRSTYDSDLEIVDDIDSIHRCIKNIVSEIEHYKDGIVSDKKDIRPLTPAYTFKCFNDKEVKKLSNEEIKDYYLRCKRHLKFLKSQFVKLISLYRIENNDTKLEIYQAATRGLVEYLNILQALAVLMEAHPSELMSMYLEDSPELNEFVKSTIQDIIQFNDSGIGNVLEDRIGYKYWETIRNKINDPIDARSFSELTMNNITKCSTIYLKKSVGLGLKDFDLTMIDIIVKYFYFMEKIYFQATGFDPSDKGDI